MLEAKEKFPRKHQSGKAAEMPPSPAPGPRASEHPALHSENNFRQIAEQDPEFAARMVRMWLKGGGDHA